ncbi:piggyBac transposable element-derived protein 4-like [Epinephelus moara]|uniref:piggyBac transposable element-derived protein 4-like n=1 Tax=Epinephelus moara TaxID=300413 RepID=UPI00214E57F7|nr:piggyBac transposable element-derived protein 4-like [Epinephelus moara]
MSDQDTQPPPHNFVPCQPSGPTIGRGSRWTPFQLFKLFFNTTVVCTLITNTNKMAQKMKAAGKKFRWKPVSKEEFYTFVAVIIFCGLVKCPVKDDYWRKQSSYNFRFPSSVMSRNRFNSIFWCLHWSDPDEDEENNQKKGTPQHDRLFKVKPLYDDILLACKATYYPGQQLSTDERMLATKARIGFKQYLPLKPTKWGIKLFVLADMNGYTWNYFIYEGKTAEQLTDGLGHSAVMRLLDVSLLGTGYQVYMDNFYTSPKLLSDLDQKKIMVCGTMRESHRGFPAIEPNKLLKKAKRGEFRWLRMDRLLFVQWMDTKQVTVVSNFHRAFSGFITRRRVRDEAGNVCKTDVTIPDAVKDYNAFMGGVDLSDALIGYYSVLHKTMKWYK